MYDVKWTWSKVWAPLLYNAFISNLSVADEPKLIVGLPSLTALYIVTSPAAISVVAPAAPNEVNPAKVVKLGWEAVVIVPAEFQVPVVIVPTEVICVCAASTPITELAAVSPVPANNVAKAVVVVNWCVELSPESNVANQSPCAGVAGSKSPKFAAKETSPLEPPPDKPLPAETLVISPTS